MNSADKKNLAALVSAEFSSRRNAVDKAVTESEIEVEIVRLISAAKMSSAVKKLNLARKTVEKLEKDLSVWASGLLSRGSKKRLRRRNGCECHYDYADILHYVAESNLTEAKDSQRKIEKLNADVRRLLAKIQVATTEADLGKIAKEAGLL